MLHFILTQSKEIPSNSYFVKTIVTTDLQRKIAEKYGVDCENTPHWIQVDLWAS